MICSETPIESRTAAGDVALEQEAEMPATKPTASKVELSEPQPAQAGNNRLRKILYVTGNLPFGPGEAFLIPEVQELLRRGYNVRIVPRTPMRHFVHKDAAELQECCTARSLLCWDVLKGALKEIFLRPLAALRALAVIFRGSSWGTFAKNLAVYPKGLWLGGVARAWQADHIHVHWVSTPTTMGMVAGIVSQTPWSCTAHRVDIALNNLLAEKLRQASFVRFISQSGWRMATSLGAPPDRRNAAVMRLGVNLPSQAEIPTCPGPRTTILCPSNLYPVKGHRYLIEAIAMLRTRGVDCKLLVAGAGELRRSLEAQVQELGLADAVQLLGQCSHTEILSMYREGRVGMVVLPSVDLGHNLHEGVPVALIEAMSYCVPVVGTLTGGIPELLEGGVGQIVPDKDPEALADAIERYVRDPAFAAEVARKGRQRVSESFNVIAVVSQLLERIFPENGLPESSRVPSRARAGD